MQNYSNYGAWNPGPRQAVIILADRDDIGLVHIYPDQQRHGFLTAMCRTGFLHPDGRPGLRCLRTGTKDRVEAERMARDLVEELLRKWDYFAAFLEPQKAGTPCGRLAGKLTTAQRIAVLLDLWAWRDRSMLAHYHAVCARFLRLSGGLANQEPCRYRKADCLRIREGILKQLSYMGGVRQIIRNLRFVLREAGFAEELVLLFDAPRCRPSETNKGPVPFLARERKAILKNLPKADRTTRGLVLLTANHGLYCGDVAFATVDQLREAKDALGGGKRIRAGNPFQSYPWPMTQAWNDEAPKSARGYYLFPEIVFTQKELAQADTNRGPLSEAERKARLFAVGAKAKALVNHYLKTVCAIDRKGVSSRSFRWTSLPQWEAKGVR